MQTKRQPDRGQFDGFYQTSLETDLEILQDDTIDQEDLEFNNLFDKIKAENIEGFLFVFADQHITSCVCKNCLICDSPYKENQKLVECSCKCVFHKDCLLDTVIFRSSCPNCGSSFLKSDKCSNCKINIEDFTSYKTQSDIDYYSQAQKRLKIASINPSKSILDNRSNKIPIVSKNSLETKSITISSSENNGHPESSIFLFTFMQNSYSYRGLFNQNNKPHGYGKLYTLTNNLCKFEGNFVDGKIYGETIVYDYVLNMVSNQTIGFMLSDGSYKGKVKFLDSEGQQQELGKQSDDTVQDDNYSNYNQKGKLQYRGGKYNSLREKFGIEYHSNGQISYIGEFDADFYKTKLNNSSEDKFGSIMSKNGELIKRVDKNLGESEYGEILNQCVENFIANFSD